MAYPLLFSNTYGIPTTLLEQFRDTCSESLLFVLNNCIEKSTFDKDLNYADITPIHKKDDATNKANYRPNQCAAQCVKDV